MASRSAPSRLSRRIMQFSIAVVAVLVSASATSSAQTDIGRGDPDVGDVLGVNEQGGSSLKTLQPDSPQTARTRIGTTGPNRVSGVSSASRGGRWMTSEPTETREERQSSASR